VVVVIDLGKRNVLGIMVDAVDYDAAADKILTAARERRPFAASALAVHGVMTGVQDPEHGYRLNHFDLVTPDGQPVRWALNLLHRTGLSDRVYGPTLMHRLCATAAEERIPIYLYGSEPAVLERLKASLAERFPDLVIAGAEGSKFRRTTTEEKDAIARRMRESGAGIVFVGLGCPRQEVFAYEYRDLLDLPVVAVGAAFEYHAGVRREPHPTLQRAGLQWLHRLIQEPRRLWKRYTIVSATYVGLVVLQGLRMRRTDPTAFPPPSAEVLHG
jgi:N-acetylglucosaminyldiphosphoundecaprenol N-acetyl-beta-D-mannosaminyltransferase